MNDMSSVIVVFLVIFLVLYMKNNHSGSSRNGQDRLNGPNDFNNRNRFNNQSGYNTGSNFNNQNSYNTGNNFNNQNGYNAGNRYNSQSSYNTGNGFNGQNGFNAGNNYNNQEQLRWDSTNHRVIINGQTNGSYHETRNGSYNEQKEVSEAIRAGENALRSLQNAERSLQSARGWGMMDIVGGGLISGAIKHSRVSESKRYLEDAKYQLQNFRNELADVASVQNIDIDIGDFLTFADFFFDGFFADLIVQSRISDAHRKLQDAIAQVQDMLGRLYAMQG